MGERATSVQRSCACAAGHDTASGGDCEECRQNRRSALQVAGTLQCAGASAAWTGAAPPLVHEVLGTPGEPLDIATQSSMEPRFGHDFARVRIHADSRAAESARAVHALAYTVGRHVVFGPGQFSPTSAMGRRLLAHELAHVVQQDGAPARSGSAELSVESPGSASEIEAAAERVARAESEGLSVESARSGSEIEAATDRPVRAELVAALVASQSRQQVSRQIDPMGPFIDPASRQNDPMRGRGPSASRGERRPGAPPSYREATELAECIRIMGDQASAYCRQTVLGEAPPRPPLRIAREGGDGQSFISTDRITLDAGPAGPASWTVHGVSTNAGDGNPHQAANRTRFSFRPNPTNRPVTGSRAPNAPIAYRVEAIAGGQTASFDLIQDEADIIRQEYIDLGPRRPPDRSIVVTPGNAMFNTGNYSLIVDGGMDNAFNGTETEFQALTPAGTVAPAIGVSSGYRNPRRNVAAGSQFPVTSRHVLGTALDLTVPGANATLWARLRRAGANAGNGSICERGPTQIPCDDPTVDHVHIQW